MAMQFFPLFEDTKVQVATSPFNYYIQVGGETVYRGRAWKSPKDATIGINVRRIAQDYLENHKDILLDGVEKQEEAYREVYLYDASDDTLVAYYGVLFDSYAPWSGESKTLSQPVNGHMDPRMRIPYSRYNQTGTTIGMETEDIYFFDAQDTVSVDWDAGQAVVPISTNRWLNDITVSLPSGVTVQSRSLTGWTFNIPVNYEDSSVTYTINWYVKGELVDSTVITVYAMPYEFECEPSETADPFGEVVDIWFNTDAPLNKIAATVSDGSVSALTEGHLLVSVPQNGTGSARTVTATFLINGTPVGSCLISQAYEVPWTFSATASTIPFSGGTYVLPISSNKPVSEITVDTPSGITYVSKVQSAFTFNVAENETTSEQTFVLTFHWRNQTRTVTLTQDVAPYFLAQETVEMSFYGGKEFVWIDTSYNISDITFVVPQGVTVSNKTQNGYNLTLPANGTSSAVTYTIVYKYGNTVLGQTVATVYGNEYYSKYFTVEIEELDSYYEDPRFLWEVHNELSTSALTLYYSVNNGSWTRFTVNRYRWEYLRITGVTVGDTVRFKSNGGIPTKRMSGVTVNSRTTFASPQKFKVYGNIMSLVYGDSFTGKTTFPARQFYAMFTNGGYGSETPNLTDVTNLILPATNVPDYGYVEMFYNCDLIERFPAMAPATTVGISSYQGMFSYCINVNGQVPELPATTVKASSYSNMFEHCTGMMNAPYLPATTLAENCYYYMFMGCSGLTEVQTSLPATTLAEGCYRGMFAYCRNLENAPDVNGTKLYKNSLESMFADCPNINRFKVMATSLDANAGEDYAFYMLHGTASNGTFIKPAAATFWTRGVRGIPNDWTVEEI